MFKITIKFQVYYYFDKSISKCLYFELKKKIRIIKWFEIEFARIQINIITSKFR